MRIPYTGIVLLAGLSFWSCDPEISPSQADAFIKQYGNYGVDNASGIAVLENGGYAISGTSVDPDSGSRMILILTDEFGNLEEGFPRYFTEPGMDAGAHAIVAKNGGQNGFLLAGYIEDGSGDRDIYLVKTSPNGNFNWSRTYGSAENESVLHATEGIGYEFILAGYQEKSGEKDIMVMAINQNGDSIRLGLNYNKPINSTDASANFILNAGDTYMCVCTYNKFVGEGTDLLILHFDDGLSPIDEIIRGDFDEMAKCVVRDSEESYLLLGNRDNALSGNSEVLVYSVTTNGLPVNTPTLLATISERNTDLYSERLVKTGPERFAIVGTREGPDGEDIFVQMLEQNQLGDRILFGSAGDQSGADVGNASNGGLVVLGNNAFQGNSMISLIKTDDSGNL